MMYLTYKLRNKWFPCLHNLMKTRGRLGEHEISAGNYFAAGHHVEM